MRKLFTLFLLICIFLNPVFLFAEQISGSAGNEAKTAKEEEISRQEAIAVNKELDAQLQKSNAEVEQMRLKAQEQTLRDIKQAEKDLEISIQEFQKEKFPEEIKKEKSSEDQ